MIFCARQFKFIFPRPALVMGIVNVTPDSFSDGGRFLDTDAAVARALELARQGAEILDIGGESTRPGAAPVSEREELRRVIPVIKALASEFRGGKTNSAPISIDTIKPVVARAALEAGASIVNDVAAGQSGPKMWEIVSQYRAGYVVMHAPPGLHEKPDELPCRAGVSPAGSSGVSPRVAKALKKGGGPQAAPEDIAGAVGAFFVERLNALETFGVAREQIIFDPGIGFGKNLEQNLQIMAHFGRFLTLGRPLLLGVSRKSFIEKLFGSGVNERLPASLACAILGVESGVHMIRAHDVADTVQAIRMAEAVLKRQKRPVDVPL